MAAELSDRWNACWARLAEGVHSPDSPFHQGVLATLSPDGAQARYVVLRDADAEAGMLSFHTDARSMKIRHLALDARASWCFYGEGLQLRAQGRVELLAVEDSPTAEQAWLALDDAQRAMYLGNAAPGSELPAAGLLLSDGESPRQFRLARLQLQSLDALWLHRDGQVRRHFERGPNEWKESALVP
jgi:hypothetical protein